jgi:hypothetical protein
LGVHVSDLGSVGGVALDYGSLDGCGYVHGEWCVAFIGFANK